MFSDTYGSLSVAPSEVDRIGYMEGAYAASGVHNELSDILCKQVSISASPYALDLAGSFDGLRHLLSSSSSSASWV